MRAIRGDHFVPWAWSKSAGHFDRVGGGLASGQGMHLKQERMRRHVGARRHGLRCVQQPIEIIRVSVRMELEIARIAQIRTQATLPDQDHLIANVVAGITAALTPFTPEIGPKAFAPDLLRMAADAAKILVNHTALYGQTGKRLRIERLIHRILELAKAANLLVRRQQQPNPREGKRSKNPEK